jgi:hypothetical protein
VILNGSTPYWMMKTMINQPPNPSVERDAPQAALVRSLRSYAATTAPHVKRWAAREPL